MSAETTIRDSLNTADPNRIPDVLRTLQFGEVFNLLLSQLTATETGVTPASNVATLAAQPTALILINGTAGTSTGIKTLLRGQISGPGAIVPAPGQAVWDGGKKVLFNAADAITAAAFTYATAANVSRSALAAPLDK